MYDYRFRSAPDSTKYSTLRFAGFLLELKQHLEDKMAGKSSMKCKFEHGESTRFDGS